MKLTDAEKLELKAFAERVSSPPLRTSATRFVDSHVLPAPYDPTAVACIVLGKPVPMTVASVETLLKVPVAELVEVGAEDSFKRCIELTSRQIGSPPDVSFNEWNPIALGQFCSFYAAPRQTLNGDAATWIAAAVRAGAHEHWNEEESWEALTFLDEHRASAKDKWAVGPGCDQLLTRLGTDSVLRAFTTRPKLREPVLHYLARRAPDDSALASRCVELLVNAPGEFGATVGKSLVQWLARADESLLGEATLALWHRQPELARDLSGYCREPFELATVRNVIDPSGHKLREALYVLRDLGNGVGPRTLASLEEGTRHSDPVIAIRSTLAVAALKSEAARPRLLELVRGSSGPISWAAIRGLAELSRDATTASVLRGIYGETSEREKAFVLAAMLYAASSEDDLDWIASLAGNGVELPDEALIGVVTAMLMEQIPMRAALVDHAVEALRSNPKLIHFAPHARGIVDRLEGYLADNGTPEPSLIEELAREELRAAIGGPRSSLGVHAVFEREPGPPRMTTAPACSVLAPDGVPPDHDFVLEVFMHDKRDIVRVAELASDPHARRFTTTSRPIDDGVTITVAISIPGVMVRESVAELYWDGDLGIASFGCYMPQDAVAPTYEGTARVEAEGVEIVRARFVIALAPDEGKRKKVGADEAIIRTAFASYATEERAAVLARIQGMQKVVPFLDIFLDVISLRSGDDWAKRIHDEILAREVLLLFWSQAASRSQYVDAEWRTAFAARGLPGVAPVPLEDAEVAPPPAELASLQFHDWTLSIKTTR